MFKLAIYLNNDNDTIDPFACKNLVSYLKDSIIVMTQSMLQMTNDLELLDVSVQKIIVIGDANLETKHPVYVCKDFAECLKYLLDNYRDMVWWLLGDNQLANELIWKGIVMDVHLSKSNSVYPSEEYRYTLPHMLDDPVLFDKALLKDPSMKFKLISGTFDLMSSTRSHRHYFRRNEEEYHLLNVMREIVNHGFRNPNRTGIDTRSIFGKQFEYRMTERSDPKTNASYYRIPLLTTKKMFVRGIFEELKWFLGGGTNSKTLEKKGVNIWKGNTSRAFLDSNNFPDYQEGETGPIYGFQWTHWGAPYVAGKSDYDGQGINQIQKVIQSLQSDPFSRRHIISSWNPSQLSEMCLPPCHVLYQFMVHEDKGQKYLSLSMYQRSCDTFLGLPFNICSIAIFLLKMAHRVGMKPYKVIHSIGDMHIYENHIEAVETQLKRVPFEFPYARLVCDAKSNIQDYEFTDLEIQDYHSHKAIKADMVA